MLLGLLGWSHYVDKAAQIRHEAGFRGLCSRLLHKLASPALDWGHVTFFVRPLNFGTLPAVEAPPDVQLKRVPESQIADMRPGGDPAQTLEDLAQRCRRGDQAFAAIAANGETAHLRWLTTSRARIPELERDIVLGPRQAYFYNGFTRPDMRGRGFDGLVRQFIFQTLHDAGCGEVFSYVRGDNPAGFRAASRWQQPVATVWYFRIRPFRPVVVNRSRSAIPPLVEPQADAGSRGPSTPLRASSEEAWARWFRSWLDEPFSKRSTGCTALTDPSFQSAASFIDSSLQINASDIVLDVGCDSAMISRLIAPRCRRFVGIDFIPGMLRDAQRHQAQTAEGRPAWFAAGDGCHLPLRSGAFTKVYCSAMIHTLPSREHGHAVIRELLRVTAPGGRILVSSVPDRAKRRAALAALWRRAGWGGKLTLPIRWLIPRPVKQLARRLLRRPSSELPAFLNYDLKGLRASLETRGATSEIRDFPADYWSPEFRTSRANLLIAVPPLPRGRADKSSNWWAVSGRICWVVLAATLGG